MLTIERDGIASIVAGTHANASDPQAALGSFGFLGLAVHRALRDLLNTIIYARWSDGGAASAAGVLSGGVERSRFRATDVRGSAAPLSRDSVVTIEQDGTVALIVQMDVDPTRADALLAELNVSTDTILPEFRAVRSVSFHLSADGSRIVEYLQAEDAEAMAAIQARTDMKEHERRVAALARSLTTDLYRVDRLVHPALA